MSALPTLLLPEIGVTAILCEKFPMIAALNDPALVHHADQISIHSRAQSMSDHKHGVLTFELLNGLPHQTLSFPIMSTGGLIKNQQFRISQNGPLQGDALPLATTKAETALAN